MAFLTPGALQRTAITIAFPITGKRTYLVTTTSSYHRDAQLRVVLTNHNLENRYTTSLAS